VAMWYGFLEGDIVFETFAKSQKVANVRRDSRITVLVEDGEVYEELRGVEIVGRAEVIEDSEAVVGVAREVIARYHDFDDADDVEGAAQLMAQKRVGIRIRPDRVVSWDHRKLEGAY
jgi:PPOX class probable F420-dependent enzyme